MLHALLTKGVHTRARRSERRDFQQNHENVVARYVKFLVLCVQSVTNGTFMRKDKMSDLRCKKLNSENSY